MKLSRLFPSVAGLILVVALGALSVFIWSCEYPKSPANGNTLPETRIANVPANDTIAQYIRLGVIPEITLYWVGDDPDGFVVAFKYRWIDFYRGNTTTNPYVTILNIVNLGGINLQQTMVVKGKPQSLPEMYRFFSTMTLNDTALIRAIGDSLATFRPFAVPYKTGVLATDSIYGATTTVHRAPTTGRFIFDSPADSNMHRFEIVSIDNSGAEDPSPAKVNFWTLKSPAPLMRITPYQVNTQISYALNHSDTDKVAIRHATDRFPGLRFDFAALDPSTFDIVYSWAVDDTLPSSWSSYSESTTAFVTASSFKPIVSGTHRFFVRARNRWGVLSNIASDTFRVKVPDIDTPGYPQKILILNSDMSGDGTAGKPDSNQINRFYKEILDSLGKSGKYDVWTVRGQPTVKQFPDLLTLGKYTSVIFLLESKLPTIGVDASALRFTTFRQGLMRRYLQCGGKLVFSGPQDYTRSFNTFEDWSEEIFHTLPRTFFPYSARVNNNLDFAGTKGDLGYPNLPLDAAKLHPDSLGSIRSIIVNFPWGFAQTISTFDSRDDNPLWENQPVGIRFIAPAPVPPARATYSVVHFGFPLYFAQKSPAIQGMRKAFSDISE
jgi:hypothetical protein